MKQLLSLLFVLMVAISAPVSACYYNCGPSLEGGATSEGESGSQVGGGGGAALLGISATSAQATSSNRGVAGVHVTPNSAVAGHYNSSRSQGSNISGAIGFSAAGSGFSAGAGGYSGSGGSFGN